MGGYLWLNADSDYYGGSNYKTEYRYALSIQNLAVEMLSPGTARYDRVKKYNAYARAGVREYWIADPQKKTVEVLHLEGETYQSAGVFSGEQKLPSLVVLDFPVRVEQIFA